MLRVSYYVFGTLAFIGVCYRVFVWATETETDQLIGDAVGNDMKWYSIVKSDEDMGIAKARPNQCEVSDGGPAPFLKMLNEQNKITGQNKSLETKDTEIKGVVVHSVLSFPTGLEMTFYRGKERCERFLAVAQENYDAATKLKDAELDKYN